MKNAQMEELLNDIRHFRSFNFRQVDEAFGIELAKSTVKMLMKLNVKEYEVLVYEPRLAIMRGVTLGHCNQPYYGISYRYSLNMPPLGETDSFEMDGKFYELISYWDDILPIQNCSVLQPCFANNIEPHYNYLRMEIGKKPKDRRFSIKPWK